MPLLETLQSLVKRKPRKATLKITSDSASNTTHPTSTITPSSPSKTGLAPSSTQHEPGEHSVVAADATPVQSHIVSAALTPQPQARPSAGLLISALGVENQPAPSASGQFQGAHNFTIQDSVFAERIEIFQSGAMVMQLLDKRRIPGSEFNSAARHPPPQCHPGTRQTLQGKISSWLVDPQRDCRMLWVLGPAGVGKSAVAQTVADHYSGELLGAAFFFSGLGQRDDPYRVIPTIAHQLARQYSDYKQIITQRFAGDSSILEKTLRSQFNELIIEPFRLLAALRPPHLQQPCLIILDGLDECRGEEEQCEIIQLISDHARQVKNFPLLWMVCSRPEWHLKSLLADSDFQITCIREELKIDDTEARGDVFHVLSDGFDSIRRKYRDRLSITWPPLASLNQLADAASGHFGFASTVLGFVGDRDCGNPGEQLNICIQVLKDGRVLESKNPFRALDLLYTHILSRVPVDILPITMIILGFSIFVHSHQLSAQVQANFLHLDQSAFYHSLQKLHSILRIPEPPQADMEPIGFYHASFGDFLKDPNRSNVFALDQASIYSNLQDHALCWYQHTLLDNITLTASQTIPWSPHATKKNWILSQLRDFASYALIFYV